MGRDNDQIRECLRSVAVGLLTPFDSSRRIQHEKLADNANRLHDEGVRTFLAAANISEYHALSPDERVDVVRTSVESLPDDACVLAGAGGSLSTAEKLISEYEQTNVDAIMVMPPDHTYLHEQGLLEYYRQLGGLANRPLVPYVRGFDPSTDFLAQLTEVEAVVGIKYALKDGVKLGSALSRGDPNVVWINGLAEPYALSYWAEGVEGFSAGVSNFRPRVGLALFDALDSGDWEFARRLRNVCLPFQDLRDEPGPNNTLPGGLSVPTVKRGMELAGLHGGNVRPPIEPLPPAQEERVREVYDQLDRNIDRLL